MKVKMMFELVLALYSAVTVCSPVTSTSATLVRRYDCAGDFAPYSKDMQYSGCRQMPQNCEVKWEAQYAFIERYPDLRSCMEAVARIGESDRYGAICRKVR